MTYLVVLLPMIVEIFSMQFFGSYKQVCHGEIYHLIMCTAIIPIAVFVDGEIASCGKESLKFLFLNQTLNGSGLIQAISKFTLILPEYMVVIRIWNAQKGAQLQDISAR